VVVGGASSAIISLYRGRSRRPVVRIIPDGQLYRIEWPDIGPSGLVNLSRAKAAALEWAERQAMIEHRNLSVAQRLKLLDNFHWTSSPVAFAADFEPREAA